MGFFFLGKWSRDLKTKITCGTQAFYSLSSWNVWVEFTLNVYLFCCCLVCFWTTCYFLLSCQNKLNLIHSRCFQVHRDSNYYWIITAKQAQLENPRNKNTGETCTCHLIWYTRQPFATICCVFCLKLDSSDDHHTKKI